MLNISKNRKRKLQITTEFFLRELSPKETPKSSSNGISKKRILRNFDMKLKPKSTKERLNLDALMKRRAKVNSKTIANSNSNLKISNKKPKKKSMKKELEYIKRKLNRMHELGNSNKKVSNFLASGNTNQYNFTNLKANQSTNFKKRRKKSRERVSYNGSKKKILTTDFSLEAKLHKKLLTKSLKRKKKSFVDMFGGKITNNMLVTPKGKKPRTSPYGKIEAKQRRTVGADQGRPTLFDKLRNDKRYREVISPNNRLSVKNSSNFFKKSNRAKVKLSIGSTINTPEKTSTFKRNLRNQLLKSYEKKSKVFKMSEKNFRERIKTEGKETETNRQYMGILENLKGRKIEILGLIQKSNNNLRRLTRSKRKVSLANESDMGDKKYTRVKTDGLNFINTIPDIPSILQYPLAPCVNHIRGHNKHIKFPKNFIKEVNFLQDELKEKNCNIGQRSKIDFPDEERINLPQGLREIPKLIIPKIQWNNLKPLQENDLSDINSIPLATPKLNQDFSCPTNERSYTLFEILRLQETTNRSLKTDRPNTKHSKQTTSPEKSGRGRRELSRFSKSSKKERSQDVKKELKNKGNISSRKLFFGADSKRSLEDYYMSCDEDGDLKDWDLSNYEKTVDYELREIGEDVKEGDLSSIELRGNGKLFEDCEINFEFSLEETVLE